MGVSEMRFEVYEAAAFDLLRDQVELLRARVKDDEERMLDRLERLEARFEGIPDDATVMDEIVRLVRLIGRVEKRIDSLDLGREGTYPADTKLVAVERPELEALRAVVEAAVAYADRHMTGMGAISSTGVVTDETRALWKAVGDYREQAGA